MIYVARNPKDTSVSYYHFAKMLKTYDGEFGKYLDQFVNSKGKACIHVHFVFGLIKSS